MALAAIPSAFALHALATLFGSQWLWWVDIPAVMGLYGLFRVVYSRWLWRKRVGPFSLSAIRWIGGTWAGRIKSSHNAGSDTLAMLHVRQTWSRLSVRLLTEHSTSYSLMAALNTSESRDQGLSYEYLNEPDALAVETMQAHRGTVHLTLSDDGQRLQGSYYTDRGRRNVGEAEFKLISRQYMILHEALGGLGTKEEAQGNKDVSEGRQAAD